MKHLLQFSQLIESLIMYESILFFESSNGNSNLICHVTTCLQILKKLKNIKKWERLEREVQFRMGWVEYQTLIRRVCPDNQNNIR